MCVCLTPPDAGCVSAAKDFSYSCDKFKEFIASHTTAFSSLDQSNKALLAAFSDLPKAGAGAQDGDDAEGTSDDEGLH